MSEAAEHIPQDNCKRYFTQRNMNRKIHFYGLSGIQAIAVFVVALVLYLVIGNFGPAFLLVIVPIIQINKKKLSEGDPNYLDTVKVKFRSAAHYQDTDRVLRKLGRRWLND
jgi:hypothetical protein